MESRLVARGRSGSTIRPTNQEGQNHSNLRYQEPPHAGHLNRPNGPANLRPNGPVNPRLSTHANSISNSPAIPRPDDSANRRPNTPATPRPNDHINPRLNTPANPRSNGPSNPRLGAPSNPRPNGPANPKPNAHSNPRPNNPPNERLHAPANPQPNGPVNPRPNGPTNPPLHFLQHKHRSQGIIAGGPFPKALIARHHLMKLPYHNRFEEYLVRAGLYGVHQIAHIPIDNKLITALVERWREETHTFHLPVGEMTVTLQDVSCLLGLPIDGKPLCENTNRDESWSNVVERVLGRRVTTSPFREKSSIQIKFSWIEENFPFSDDPDDPFPENHTEFYVRAYMLTLIGCVLFPDHSGDSVSAIYLLLLENLDEVGSYSWGSGTLAYLYRALCKATEPTRMQIGGPLILLQMWSWERFRCGRPQPRNGDRPKLAGSMMRDRWPPYGYRWSGYHEFAGHVTSKVTKGYRDDFDALDDAEVNWHPYKNKKKFLPRICFVDESLCLTTAPLIHFWIVEVYNPERVMRQFNRYQTIPPPLRDTCRGLHRRKHGTGNDWSVVHANHLNSWNRRWNILLEEEREYDETSLHNYMRWFSSASRLKLQTSRNRTANRPRRDPTTLEYQPREPDIRSAVRSIWRMKKHAAWVYEVVGNRNAKALAKKVMRGSKSALEDLREFTGRDDIFAVLNELQQHPLDNPEGPRRRRQLNQVEEMEQPDDQPARVQRSQVTQVMSAEAGPSRPQQGRRGADEAGPSRPRQGRRASDEAGPSRVIVDGD